MSWQIQCKQHFLKQLYTLNNQLESEETLTWHKDVQMYYWDCMRMRGGVREGDYNECWACMRLKRGAMFCCVWDFLREVWGSVREVWESLREVMWYESCSEKVMWERRWSNFVLESRQSQTWPRPDRLDNTQPDMTRPDWWEMTRAVWPASKSSL